jgi:hypothetical protein
VGGQSSELAEGQELAAGAQIATGDKSSVRLVYPDESQVQLGKKSSATFESREGKPPAVSVESGDVRAVITHAAPAKPQLKFLIKTKSVVMGVRGTDFTVHAEGDAASVHLLSGELALGKPGEEDGLGSSGTVLKQGQLIEAKAGALGAPQAFQRAQYFKELSRAQPGFKIFSAHPALKYAEAAALKDNPRKRMALPPEERRKTPGRPHR